VVKVSLVSSIVIAGAVKILGVLITVEVPLPAVALTATVVVVPVELLSTGAM
jgi:hypothetical protein